MRKLLMIFALALVLVLCQQAVTSPIYGVVVEPAIVDVSVKPGTTAKFEVIITNDERESVDVRLIKADVRFGINNTPVFLLEGEDPEISIIDWLRVSQNEFSLNPQDELSITAQVVVPTDAGPSGYYGAFLVEEGHFDHAPSEGLSAQITKQIAVLLFIEVEGDGVRRIELIEYSTSKPIYFDFPVDFNILLQNTGNLHVQPHGSIRLYNTLTGQRITDLLVNADSRYSLPQLARAFDVIWQKNPFDFHPIYFGKIKAELNLSYDNSLNLPTKVITFWMIPWYLILLVVGLVVLFALLVIYIRYRRHKVHKD